MTELVGGELRFGYLILEEEFDYGGKPWRSFLVIPQEHLEDLFRSRAAIRPTDAYERERDFWDRISAMTRDLYIDYLRTQDIDPTGSMRRQWFQWRDFSRLEAAFRAFKDHSNQPLRLSVVARDPVH